MPHAASDRIGPTAHYTAYAWHVLGLSHAEWFATPLGRRLFAAYRVAELPQRLARGYSPLLRTLENRHRLIDRVLLETRPDCVVELGAGLSRRGVTWAIEHNTPILVATRGRGAAPDFKNLDAVRALFAQAGFTGLEALEDLLPDVLSCVVRTPAGEA